MEVKGKRFTCISYSPLSENMYQRSAFVSLCARRRLIGIFVASILGICICYNVYHSCDDDIPLWREYYLRYFSTPLVECDKDDDSERVQSKISYRDLEQDLEKSPRALCNCKFKSQRPFSEEHTNETLFVKSRCSAEATLIGEGQKVISYNLFWKQSGAEVDRLNFWRNYVAGVSRSLMGIRAQYPGWVVRIYTNETISGLICDIVCADSDLFFCDVNKLDYLKTAHPLTWRYAPLGDPTVKQFLSRDLNSKATERERMAVSQWEHSQFPFHNMRDHPDQKMEILGGLWGGNNEKFCYGNGVELLRNLTDNQWYKRMTQDEEILSKVLYGPFRNLILNHDSYHCQLFRDSLPFPTQRSLDKDFVGKVEKAVIFGVSEPLKAKVISQECPLSCRPTYGEDWIYC